MRSWYVFHCFVFMGKMVLPSIIVSHTSYDGCWTVTFQPYTRLEHMDGTAQSFCHWQQQDRMMKIVPTDAPRSTAQQTSHVTRSFIFRCEILALQQWLEACSSVVFHPNMYKTCEEVEYGHMGTSSGQNSWLLVYWQNGPWISHLFVDQLTSNRTLSCENTRNKGFA